MRCATASSPTSRALATARRPWVTCAASSNNPGRPCRSTSSASTAFAFKIPKVSDEVIISVFSGGVRDVKMKDELAIHEELRTSQELFNLATKCARAEEGCLSLLELPDADPEDKKTKTKDTKRKGPAVLAAEPETKCACDHPESSKSNRPFCVFHNVHSHPQRLCAGHGDLD